MMVETHLGVVMVNDSDPEKDFGIEVMIDSLLPDTVWPEICRPIFPPNIAKAPDPGQIVECIVIADEFDESGWADLGVENDPDFCCYTGRIFNSTKEGKIPADLKTNYPKRAALFWDADGTIVYYDSTKNKKEFLIALTDRKTFIRLKEDEIFIQQNQNSWQMKGGKIVTTVDATEMGAAGASEPILLGNIVHSAFTAFLASWQTEIATWGAIPPLDPGAATYLTNIAASITALQNTLSNWRSSKHKVDS